MIRLLFFLGLLLVVISACHPLRNLTPGELLYNGAEFKVSGIENEKPGKSLKAELESLSRPQANQKILGLPYRLWVYQQIKKPIRKKGIRSWLKNKIGEAPVFYRPDQIELSRQILQKNLQDNGYFNAKVEADTVQKVKRVTVQYQLNVGGRFHLNNYILHPDSTALLALIAKKPKRPFIKSGQPYSLDNIKAERQRLTDVALDNGYFDFAPSTLIFYRDTANQARYQYDLYLSVQPPANRKDFQFYTLGNITVHPNYNLNTSETDSIRQDTIREGSWTLIQNQKIIRLKALQEAIIQDSGAVYSRRMEKQTINYLLDLGVFKFVNLKYVKDSINGNPVLHRNLFLTPTLNQDARVELEASTQSGNFLGYAVNFSYLHRNLFRGAEQFSNTLSAGVETQAGGGGPFINTLETSFKTKLTFPRLLVPFKAFRRQLAGSIPKTVFSLGAAYQQRNELFTNATVQLEWAYHSRPTSRLSNQYAPFQVTSVKLLKTSTDLEQQLLDNPRLRASFDDVIILGGTYGFTYSTQRLNTNRDYLYLNAELETAGNIPNLTGRLLNGKSPDSYRIFGVPISQFVRAQTEIRYNFLNPKNSAVARFFGGFILPYGNNKVSPYIRQFFSGGASSIRAFRFRGLGPGGVRTDTITTTGNLAYFDRVGDLKLEANLEFRFNLIPYFKGAVFVDAGNVWSLSDPDNVQPEGLFKFNRFTKEIAVGTGVGLRLDVQYFIIRLDLGIPLRNPGMAEGDRWVVRQIKFGDPVWRKNNLIWNLAVGYPF